MAESKKALIVRKKALKIIEFIMDKKADDPVLLDLRQVSSFCDYFIVCSGSSQRQARAIYESAKRLSKKNSITIYHAEDDIDSNWLLVDYFDIVLHIFNKEARSFYNLEKIWREAKKIRLPKNLTEEKT